MSDGYEVETVECPTCDGCGQVEHDWDLFMPHIGTCTYCGGNGWVEVCANCFDDWSGCSVCNPPTVVAAAGGGQAATGEK